MLRRAFLIFVIVIPLIMAGLSGVLYLVEARHGRVIEDEGHTARILNTVNQASLLFDRVRERVVASVYLPLDHATLQYWSEELIQKIDDPQLGMTPENRQLQREILAETERFIGMAYALPVAPAPGRVLQVREQAEAVADLLNTYRAQNSLNFSALLITEKQQRIVSILVLVLGYSMLAVLAIGGLYLLVRVGQGQAEAQALRATEQLRGEFVAFAAHELRNPASAIKTGASMLRDDALDAEIRVQVVDSINRSADALSRVVLNLLNLGRIEAGELRLQRQQVALPALIDGLVSELQIYHPGIETRLHCTVPAATVHIDPEFIKLVISNLLDNATKYSPANAPVYLLGSLQDDKVVLHVRDVGTGIPPELLPNIFEKYETSGEAPGSTRRGIGLGLYMARLLIEAHGGRIWAESTLGHGTTISFTMPVSAKME